MKLTRERFIPKDYVKKMEFPELKAVAFQTGPLSVMAFAGKKAKPVFYYRFSTKEQMKEHIKTWAKQLKEEAARKAKYAADKKKPNEMKVGDIMYDSWGWEQTNIDWYEVVDVKGSFVVLKQLNCKIVESNGHSSMSGNSMPIPGSYRLTLDKEETIRRKISHGNICKPLSFSYCKKWDGTPKYCSWYA